MFTHLLIYFKMRSRCFYYVYHAMRHDIEGKEAHAILCKLLPKVLRRTLILAGLMTLIIKQLLYAFKFFELLTKFIYSAFSLRLHFFPTLPSCLLFPFKFPFGIEYKKLALPWWFPSPKDSFSLVYIPWFFTLLP